MDARTVLFYCSAVCLSCLTAGFGCLFWWCCCCVDVVDGDGDVDGDGVAVGGVVAVAVGVGVGVCAAVVGVAGLRWRDEHAKLVVQ